MRILLRTKCNFSLDLWVAFAYVVGVSDETTVPEVARRLVYTLLGPAAKLCVRFRVPVGELEQLARLAYYSELRGQGLTQAEAARISGKSRRTVVSAEQQLRSDFLAPQEVVTLSRRVEEAIDAGPRTLEAVAAELGADEDEVEHVLEALVAAERAVLNQKTDGSRTWREAGRFRSLVIDHLPARLDGLRHQLEVLVTAVTARFFTDDARPAVGRTLSFRGAAEDVRRFVDELIGVVRHNAVDIEERALQGGERDRYAITLALAPMGQDEPSEGP